MKDKTNNVFSQLQELCIHVDSRVKSLKQEVTLPPRQRPQNYDEGLGKLRGDIEELKRQSQGIRETLMGLKNYQAYLRGARELVEEQIASTEKMEQYCAQYGYVIPANIEAETSVPSIEVTSAEDTAELSSNSPDKFLRLEVTPELNINTRMAMQGKVPPLLTSTKKATTPASKYHPSTPTTAMTPSTKDTSLSKLPMTPRAEALRPPYMMMEQWMNMTNESLLRTPNTTVTKSPWRSETPGGRLAKIREVQSPTRDLSLTNETRLADSTHLSVLSESYREGATVTVTPPEPELSALGTQAIMQVSRTSLRDLEASCLSERTQITTPEEPVLYSQKKGLDGLERTQITTPEEPVLYSQKKGLDGLERKQITTPEEPILYSQKKGLDGLERMQVTTPEEPILYSQQVVKNSYETGTPLEPVLHYKENYPPTTSQGREKEHTLSYPLATEDAVWSYQKSSIDLTPPAPLHGSYRRAGDPVMQNPNTDDVPKTPELSDMTKSVLSFMSRQPKRDCKEHEDSNVNFHNIGLQGASKPQFSTRGISQADRNHQVMLQRHRDNHETSQRYEPHHTKAKAADVQRPRQSFSEAMNVLSRRDEIAWTAQSTYWNTYASAKTSQEKAHITEDQYQVNDFPPSPQLSDITQRILGQLRH